MPLSQLEGVPGKRTGEALPVAQLLNVVAAVALSALVSDARGADGELAAEASLEGEVEATGLGEFTRSGDSVGYAVAVAGGGVEEAGGEKVVEGDCTWPLGDAGAVRVGVVDPTPSSPSDGVAPDEPEKGPEGRAVPLPQALGEGPAVMGPLRVTDAGALPQGVKVLPPPGLLLQLPVGEGGADSTPLWVRGGVWEDAREGPGAGEPLPWELPLGDTLPLIEGKPLGSGERDAEAEEGVEEEALGEEEADAKKVREAAAEAGALPVEPTLSERVGEMDARA